MILQNALRPTCWTCVNQKQKSHASADGSLRLKKNDIRLSQKRDFKWVITIPSGYCSVSRHAEYYKAKNPKCKSNTPFKHVLNMMVALISTWSVVQALLIKSCIPSAAIKFEEQCCLALVISSQWCQFKLFCLPDCTAAFTFLIASLCVSCWCMSINSCTVCISVCNTRLVPLQNTCIYQSGG